jgi:hypothetical protein
MTWTKAIARITVGGEGGYRGTGALISDGRDGGLVLTAFHVIKMAFGGLPIRVVFGDPKNETWTCGDGTATCERYSVDDDWALLRLCTGELQARALPLAKATALHTAFKTFGFPEHERDVGGEYQGTLGAFGPKKIELRVANLPLGADMRGISGAPCIVNGEIVGIILQSLTDEREQATKASFYMLPIERAIASYAGLLDWNDGRKVPFEREVETRRPEDEAAIDWIGGRQGLAQEGRARHQVSRWARMNGVERIAKVRDVRPLVADLARALSLAAHIDVALVRTMRAKLFDRADVTTEADLWASPLIQTRSSGAITLRTDVRAALWDELRADWTELERCWAALDQARSPGRPLRALEERLTYLAIKDDRAGIEKELGTVVKAMLDDSSRRRDLSAWSARALAELPEVVRDAEAARILGTAAAGWVATPPSLANLARTPESVRLAHRLGPGDKRTRISIRRVHAVLEVGGSPPPPSVHIDIPTASPVLIIDEDTTYRIDLHGLTKIPVTRPQVMIGTSDGRRWLLRPEQPGPNLDAIGTLFGGSGPGYVYLVAPTLAVSSARHLLGREEDFSPIRFLSVEFAARLVALDDDADIALIEVMSPIPTSPLELQPDVRPGETWKAYLLPYRSEVSSREPWSGTVATGWPGITLRSSIGLPRQLNWPGMPIFVGDRVIGHLGGEPQRDGVLHATSARLVQRWIAKLTASRDQVILEVVLKANARDSLDEIEARLQRLSEREDIRVLRSEVGQVTERDVELAIAEDASILGFGVDASTDAFHLAREENVRISLHDDIDLFPKIVEDELAQRRSGPAMRRPARRKRGSRGPMPQAVPVSIHLPERISTTGLLGAILDQDGRLRRLRAHQWGHHEVTIVAGSDPRSAEPEALRVSIKDRLSETAGREFSVTTSGESPEKKEFFDACRMASSNSWGGAVELSHLPFGSDFDLFDVEITVERLPHQPPTDAYRRGIQFLVDVLEQLDSLARDRGNTPSQRPRLQSHLAITGSGKLDFDDAQLRVHRVSGDDELVLLWIDPETDIVAIKHNDGGSEDMMAIHTRVARSLGGELRRRYLFNRALDPLVGRFGVSETRGGRTISVRQQTDAVVVTVEPDEDERIDRPVRGCVVFYASTPTDPPYSRRVHASGGVATCKLSRQVRGRTIGAIIEDEGIMLESYVYVDLDLLAIENA